MTAFFLRRTFLLVPTVLGVVTAVFIIIQSIPGDPVEVMLGESALAVDKETLRHDLGLDKPLLTRYLIYLGGLVQGDLGKSIHTKEPVLRTILSRWPATLELALSALFITLLIALPLGIFSSAKHNTLYDRSSLLVSLMGIAIPNFWLGPLLIILFSIQLGWFPVSGRGGLASLILPALTLGSGMAALLMRLTRSSLLEIMGEEYITAARAKGLSEFVLYIKHGFLNALLPVVTVLGLQLGALLAGAVITETIFSWPGIGRLIITAIETRDYPLVQGCVLNISLSYVIVNFLVDIIYGFIDPRIRIEK